MNKIDGTLVQEKKINLISLDQRYIETCLLDHEWNQVGSKD